MNFLSQDEIKKNIARNLNRCLKETHKTQKDVQDYLGISQQTVSKYFNGINTPNESVLVRLAYFFGVKIEDFYGSEPFVVLSSDEIKIVELMRSDESVKISIKKIVEQGCPTTDEENIIKALREKPELLEIVKRVLDVKD